MTYREIEKVTRKNLDRLKETAEKEGWLGEFIQSLEDYCNNLEMEIEEYQNPKYWIKDWAK